MTTLLDLPDDILNHIHKVLKKEQRKGFLNKLYNMDIVILKGKVNKYLITNNKPQIPYGTYGDYREVIDKYRIPI